MLEIKLLDEMTVFVNHQKLTDALEEHVELMFYDNESDEEYLFRIPASAVSVLAMSLLVFLSREGYAPPELVASASKHLMG